MSAPVPQNTDVSMAVAAQPADAAAAAAPASFADTPYDVLADLPLPDGTTLPAGRTTTPGALGLAGNIPAVHALVVAGLIWPTGVAR